MKFMKKGFAAAALFVLTAAFSGCSGDFFDNEYVDIVISDSGEKETAPEQTIGFIGEVTAAEEPDIFSDIVDMFPIDTILLPDGSSVDKHEASRLSVDSYGKITLGFDFWFMRYAKPYFESNIEGLGEYKESLDHWETQYNNFLKALNVKYEDYFKVKTGDVLDNGMKVTGAGFTVNDEGWYRDNYVELSGEVTYEGLLICICDNTPVNADGDLILVPDPTKDIMIPIMYSGDYDDVINMEFNVRNGSYYFGDTFICLDSENINIGNKDELAYKFGIDFNKIFIRDPRPEIMYSYVKAKAIIRNMSIGDDFTTAELVDIEILE